MYGLKAIPFTNASLGLRHRMLLGSGKKGGAARLSGIQDDPASSRE
jgi:hypothetical protein